MDDEHSVSDDIIADGSAQDLADRILSGQIVADDLPGGLADVAELVGRARTARFATDPAREQRIVAAMAAAAPAPRRIGRRAALVGGALAAFSLTGGLAAAGALPGPAQDAASAVLDRVGVSVPDDEGNRGRAAKAAAKAKAQANERVEERKSAGGAGRGNGADDNGPPDGLTTPSSNVSGVARDTEPGPGHGGTVCTEASDARCDNRGSGNGVGRSDDRDDDRRGSGSRSAPVPPPASDDRDGGDRSGRGRSSATTTDDELPEGSDADDGSGGNGDEQAGAGA